MSKQKKAQEPKDLPEQEVTQEPCPQESQAGTQEGPDQQTQEPETEKKEQEPQQKEPTELEKMTAKYEELNDRLMRTLAEYDNFRKRTQREKDALYNDGRANAVEQMIPVLDTFERALACQTQDETFYKGVEMIYHTMLEVFQKLGVESFGERGDVFDPNRHNAVMQAADEELQEGQVAQVFQKGYQLGERIVRHAVVSVVK